MRRFILSLAVALAVLASGCLSDSEDRHLANHPGAYQDGWWASRIDRNRGTEAAFADQYGDGNAPLDWSKSVRFRR